MNIIIFVDHKTKEEIIIKAMEHIPRGGETVALYYPHMPVMEYLVRQVRWDLEPNELPTIYVDLEKVGSE